MPNSRFPQSARVSTGLRLEIKRPHTQFLDPSVGLMLTYPCLTSFLSMLLFYPLVSLCFSTILHYRIDSCMSPPNGRVTL